MSTEEKTDTITTADTATDTAATTDTTAETTTATDTTTNADTATDSTTESEIVNIMDGVDDGANDKDKDTTNDDSTANLKRTDTGDYIVGDDAFGVPVVFGKDAFDGIPKEARKAVVDFVNGQIGAQRKEIAAESQRLAQASREAFGADFNRTVASAKKGVERAFGKETAIVFLASPLISNNPEILRHFARFDAAHKTDGGVGTGALHIESQEFSHENWEKNSLKFNQ